MAVEAKVHRVLVSTVLPLMTSASSSSHCTVVAASRRSRPSLISLPSPSPPRSTRYALTRSRNRRAELELPDAGQHIGVVDPTTWVFWKFWGPILRRREKSEGA